MRPLPGHGPLGGEQQLGHRELTGAIAARAQPRRDRAVRRERPVDQLAVEGRLDDDFTYAGGVVVHPHVFRSMLLKEVALVEYQVRQTRSGAEILTIGSLDDPAATSRAIEAELSGLGVAGASVQVTPVAELERQETGKIRRFVPLV